jgi:5-formyltetrahydrofolate cyclo-ligase
MKKDALRKLYLNKRLTLSPKDLEIISERIAHSIFSNFQFENKKVSLFLPIERTKEINTYSIWEKAVSFDAQVAIPKVNNTTNEIKQILFESEDQLEISNWGIPEPNRGRVVAAEHFDIVLVPLLAVDKSGNRVGYGKGFYDRFLSKCSPRCVFIGLSHFDELEDRIDDIHENDVKLDACVTPNNIYRFE